MPGIYKEYWNPVYFTGADTKVAEFNNYIYKKKYDTPSFCAVYYDGNRTCIVNMSATENGAKFYTSQNQALDPTVEQMKFFGKTYYFCGGNSYGQPGDFRTSTLNYGYVLEQLPGNAGFASNSETISWNQAKFRMMAMFAAKTFQINNTDVRYVKSGSGEDQNYTFLQPEYLGMYYLLTPTTDDLNADLSNLTYFINDVGDHVPFSTLLFYRTDRTAGLDAITETVAIGGTTISNSVPSHNDSNNDSSTEFHIGGDSNNLGYWLPMEYVEDTNTSENYEPLEYVDSTNEFVRPYYVEIAPDEGVKSATITYQQLDSTSNTVTIDKNTVNPKYKCKAGSTVTITATPIDPVEGPFHDSGTWTGEDQVSSTSVEENTTLASGTETGTDTGTDSGFTTTGTDSDAPDSGTDQGLIETDPRTEYEYRTDDNSGSHYTETNTETGLVDTKTNPYTATNYYRNDQTAGTDWYTSTPGTTDEGQVLASTGAATSRARYRYADATYYKDQTRTYDRSRTRTYDKKEQRSYLRDYERTYDQDYTRTCTADYTCSCDKNYTRPKYTPYTEQFYVVRTTAVVKPWTQNWTRDFDGTKVWTVTDGTGSFTDDGETRIIPITTTQSVTNQTYDTGDVGDTKVYFDEQTKVTVSDPQSRGRVYDTDSITYGEKTYGDPINLGTKTYTNKREPYGEKTYVEGTATNYSEFTATENCHDYSNWSFYENINYSGWSDWTNYNYSEYGSEGSAYGYTKSGDWKSWSYDNYSFTRGSLPSYIYWNNSDNDKTIQYGSTMYINCSAGSEWTSIWNDSSVSVTGWYQNTNTHVNAYFSYSNIQTGSARVLLEGTGRDAWSTSISGSSTTGVSGLNVGAFTTVSPRINGNGLRSGNHRYYYCTNNGTYCQGAGNKTFTPSRSYNDATEGYDYGNSASDSKGSITTCIPDDTLITLYDNTKKPIQNLSIMDKVKIFNFYTGKYDYQYLLFIQHGLSIEKQMVLLFEDNTSLNICGNHHDVYDPVARTFRSYGFSGNNIISNLSPNIDYYVMKNKKPLKIIDIKIIEKPTHMNCIATSGTVTCIANDVVVGFSHLNGFKLTRKHKFTKDTFKHYINQPEEYNIPNSKLIFKYVYDGLLYNCCHFKPFKNEYMRYCEDFTIPKELLIEFEEGKESNVNKVKYLGKIQLPKFKKKRYKYWYNIGDNKKYRPGDIVESKYSTIFRAL